MNSREMSVAGSFYPAQCHEIKRYMDSFSHSLKNRVKLDFTPKAIISPHAGYIYSGFTANAAYSQINPAAIKRVIIIGPSHRIYLRGGSVALYESYRSPCKEFRIDQAYSRSLIERYDALCFDPSVHMEHSTETQVPFIERYFNDVELVEIVYGDIEFKDLIPIISAALEEEESFVVISTDLSHFYGLKEANMLDSICVKAIEELNVEKLDLGCEACGMTGIKALMHAAKKADLQSRVIDYRTSYDASSDASRVVGYMSALFG